MRTITRMRRAPCWLDAQAPLAEWYATALGQSILDELELVLAERLGGVFGYQGLQLGNLAPGRVLLGGAGLQRCLRLDAPSKPMRSGTDFCADATALPVASGSMKAVLFFHTLDFCAHPHQALREADRVLTEDGQLLVVGFNPFSGFGLRHLLGAGRAPWNGRFYSHRRVADWLSVLDYRVLASEPLFLRPPINSERVLARLRRLERLRPWIGGIGGVYVLQARKQTLPMTLVKRPWLRARPSGSAGIAAGLATAGHAARDADRRSARRNRVVQIDSARRRR